MKKLVLALMGISMAVALVSGCQKQEEATPPVNPEQPVPAPDQAASETPAK